jgi:hypothetical protein
MALKDHPKIFMALGIGAVCIIISYVASIYFIVNNETGDWTFYMEIGSLVITIIITIIYIILLAFAIKMYI